MTPTNIELETLRRRRLHLVTGTLVLLITLFVIALMVKWYSITR